MSFRKQNQTEKEVDIAFGKMCLAPAKPNSAPWQRSAMYMDPICDMNDDLRLKIQRIKRLMGGNGKLRLRLLGGSDVDSEISLSDPGSSNESSDESENESDGEAAGGEEASGSVSTFSVDIQQEIDKECTYEEEYTKLVEMLREEAENPTELYAYYVVPIALECIEKGMDVNENNIAEHVAKYLADEYRVVKKEMDTETKEIQKLVQLQDKLKLESKQLNVYQKAALANHNSSRLELERKATEAKIASEQVLKNKDKLNNYSRNKQIMEAVNSVKGNKPALDVYNNYKSHISKTDLRKYTYTAAIADDMEDQILEIEEKQNRIIDRNAFYAYLSEHRDKKTASEVVESAYREHLQILLNNDDLLKRLGTRIEGDKINMDVERVRSDTVLNKLVKAQRDAENKIHPNVPKISQRIPLIEKERLISNYYSIYKSLTDSLLQNKELLEYSRKTSSKAKSEDVVKTKDRYELFNAKKKSEMKKDTTTKYTGATKKSALAPTVKANIKREIDDHAISELKKSQDYKAKEKSKVDALMLETSKKAKALRDTIVKEVKDTPTASDNKSKLREVVSKEVLRRNEEQKKHAISALKAIQHQSKTGRSFAASRITPRTTSMPSGSANNSKFVKKSGDHSVHLNGVIDAEFSPGLSNVGQNAFKTARRLIYDVRNQVRWNNDNFTWEVETTAYSPVEVTPIRIGKYKATWDRFVASAALPERTRINSTLTQVKDKLDPSTATDYVKHGSIIQNKPTGDSIMSKLEISKHIAETIAPKFMDNMARNNNKGLFLQGILLAVMLQDLNNAGVQYRFNEGSADAVSKIELNPPPGQPEILTNAIDEANQNGRFVFDKRNVSPSDLMIMRLIGSGTGMIEVQDEGIQHIYQSFDMEAPKFAIIGKNLPQQWGGTYITPEQIWAFLFSMANAFNMKTDLIEGANLALRIMNGVVKHAGSRGVYFMCTLEMRKIDVPRPFYHNFLWRILDQEPKEKMNDHLQSEYDELSYMTLDEFQLTATLLSTMISAGISTMFHKYNITGRELNELFTANPKCPQVTPLLRQILYIQGGADRAAIFPGAFGIISQCFGIHLNSSAYIDSPWCAQFQWNQRLLLDNEAWQAAWPHRVPYLFDPIVLGPYANALPVEWGLSKPKMSFEIGQECVYTGEIDHQGWYASAGDKRYSNNLANGQGYRYVDYAAFATNFLMQHDPFKIRNLVMGFEIRANVGGKVMTTSIDLMHHQPVVDYVIPHIVPGTLLNWDYVTERQMVPIVFRDSFPDMMFEVLTNVKVIDSLYAGVLYEGTAMGEPLMNANTVTNEFAAMDIFSRSSGVSKQGAKFGAKEN